MNNKFVLALDIGTTRVSATLFDHDSNALFSFNNKLTQFSPHSGWYEQDPDEIWESTLSCITSLLIISKIKPQDIISVGISNQRETTIIWDVRTGKPIYNALAWESRQSDAIVQDLVNNGYNDLIHEKTGVFIDSYFSASKIMWILDEVTSARSLAEAGQLRFGTIDTWIVWKLTGGKLHITDSTNASRTMLMNIHTLNWDQEILQLLNIPAKLLPEIRTNSEIYGYTDPTVFFNTSVPIAAIAGDQQAALIGSLATHEGDAAGTYGTGAFIILNTDSKLILSSQHLISTIAYNIDGRCTYSLEGSIFVAGSSLQWLKDNLNMISNVSDVEALAAQSTDSGHMYVVPSFTGLSAPYWNSNANGATFGLTQKTTRYDFIRATLDSIAYQTNDVLTSMKKDSNIPINSFRVNGEVVKDSYLPQFLSNLSGTKIRRDKNSNLDSRGVAYLAGLAVSFWDSFDEIATHQKFEDSFTPAISDTERQKLYRGWQKAVKAVEFFTNADE